MGTLRSATDWSGRQVLGCILGDAFDADGMFAWDDPSIPDGVVDADGNIFSEVDSGEV